MKRLRFGVVGCGGVSTFYHLPSLRQCENVELTALADVNPNYLRTLAARFNVTEAYVDYRDMIGGVDAVLVATPNTTHADISCTLLEHGIHVLCEKPMATTLADARRMQETARKSRRRLMSAQCVRFAANVGMLKQLVEDGMVGKVQEICGTLGWPYSGGLHRTDFRKQRRLSGGGVLVDLGIHLIDLAVWLTGDTARSVEFYSSNDLGWEVENNAEVAIQFARGVRATLFCSFSHRLDNTLLVKGTAGWVRAPLDDPTSLSLFSNRARICQRSGLQHLRLPDLSEYDRQIDHFSHAVRSGDEFMVHDNEILTGIEIIEDCYGTALPEETSRV